MKRKKWISWLLAALVLGAAAGCEQAQTAFPDKKMEAQQRWLDARAKMLYRLAENRLTAGQLESARQSVEQALVLQPDFPEAKLLLARVDLESGRYAQALGALAKALEARPDWGEAVYLLGVAQEKLGRLDEALASYHKAHALDESNLAAVKAAAEVLVAQGNVRRAQLEVESFLPKAAEDADLLELAARLAAMSGEQEKAADLYQRTRDLDPKNVRYIEALGRAQFAAGRMEAAADTLSELVGRQGYQTPVWVYTMLGECQLDLGRTKQAFEAYFAASERSPDDPGIWAALGNSALAMEDTGRAILAGRRALQVQRDHLDGALVLGYALMRDGQAREAVGILAQAAKAHPDSSMAHCLLGRAHASCGDAAEAIRCYTTALRADPRNELARQLLSAATAEQVSRAP